MADYVRLYSWRIRGDVAGVSTGHWHTLSVKMTEAQARVWADAAGVEIERVDASVEVHEVGKGEGPG
jgi:hypothetical protein